MAEPWCDPGVTRHSPAERMKSSWDPQGVATSEGHPGHSQPDGQRSASGDRSVKGKPADPAMHDTPNHPDGVSAGPSAGWRLIATTA